jgi:WD40 repeat protein
LVNINTVLCFSNYTLNTHCLGKADEVQTSFLNAIEGFRTAQWSETACSKSQSCYLAVVTTKHRGLIYCATKDASNSDWELCFNMTDLIEQLAIPHEHGTKINPHHTLFVSWSNRIIPNSTSTKPSIFATANKTGDVCLWNVDSQNVEYLTTISAHTSYVNKVQWTSWKKLDKDTRK